MRRTKHSLGDNKPIALLGKRSEAKENQRQVKKPLRASQASRECSLERSVESLNHTITLRVETGNSGRRNPQGTVGSGPDRGGKLCSPIRRENKGNAKPHNLR